MPSNAVPLEEKSRGRRILDSAALASGAEQVVDFVLPLFAGAHLGLSPGQTGVLVAVEQLVAFLARPVADLAGMWDDDHFCGEWRSEAL